MSINSAAALNYNKRNNTTTTANIELAKRVMVIDIFSEKDINMTKGVGFGHNVSHGEIVERFLIENLPKGYEIERCEVANNGEIDTGKLYACLKKAEDGLKTGSAPAAINMSLGQEGYYGPASERLKKDINMHNLHEHKKELKDIFKQESPLVSKIISKMEKLSKDGVKIYVATGNKNSKSGDYFNVYAFAEGVNVVGGYDYGDTPGFFSNQNSLVTTYAKGLNSVREVSDRNGRRGCDYTGDGTIDLYLDGILDSFKSCDRTSIFGTSFSTPRALARDISTDEIRKMFESLSDSEN